MSMWQGQRIKETDVVDASTGAPHSVLLDVRNADGGDPCPRCGVPMQIREPNGMGDRQRRQQFFYTRWFCCMNKQCKTTLVMPARYKVANPVV